jgi:hypothetical protein
MPQRQKAVDSRKRFTVDFYAVGTQLPAIAANQESAIRLRKSDRMAFGKITYCQAIDCGLFISEVGEVHRLS